MSAVETWERATVPHDRPGIPHHQRGGALAPPSPGARLVELTQSLERMRQYLAEACVEVRRLERSDERWHSMRDTSFGGVPMAQVWADLVLWEALLNENPDLHLIVEIGTWQGGFSLWLNAQARARGMDFITYDAIRPERTIPGFHRVDVFANEEHIADEAFDEPLILFCDGGNKPRELRTFPPYLQDPRSIVVVHDWGTETHPADVPDTLEEIYGDFCDELGSISRVFRVRR